jgi:hypothetical protein
LGSGVEGIWFRFNGYGMGVQGSGSILREGARFRVIGYGLWVMGYGSWVMGYGIKKLTGSV